MLAWLRRDPFLTGLLLVGLIYVACTLTPSSYGFALKAFGLDQYGPWLGKARGIRSDEWGVWTPYLQAAVNNGFQRWNLTSIYQEDLRNFNALPLWDWALIFKPYFWPFFLTGPATAFSCYHFSLIAACLLGYRALFQKLGLDRALAASLACLLFFTGFSQHWWTTIGPSLALFPTVLLTLLWRAQGWALLAKAALLAWVSGLWLLSHLYPPLVISLGFAGAALVLILRPDLLRRPTEIAAILIGVALGTAASLWYLRDAILVMSATQYPGARISDGGGVSWRLWLGQLFPTFNQAGLSPLGAANICESSTVGTWLVLALAVFSRRDPTREPAGLGWRLVVLASAFALISLWMMAPIPSSLGRFLLWDRVPGPRMLFAAGLLLFALVALLLPVRRWTITRGRLLLFAGLVLAAWGVSKLILDRVPLWKGLLDLVILLPLGLLALPRWRQRWAAPTALTGAALFANIAAFGFFNPLQPATPIFHRPDSAITQALRAEAAAHPAGWVVRDGFFGALLNGWGFPSVSHTIITPQLDFFRLYYPDLRPDELDQIFNRYMTLTLADGAAPHIVAPDQVRTGPERFRSLPPGRTILVNPGATPAPAQGGWIEAKQRDGLLVLRGWAPWSGLGADQRLELFTDSPVTLAGSITQTRHRIDGSIAPPGQTLSGFAIPLRLPDTLDPGSVRFCVVAVAPDIGRMRIRDPQHPDRCAWLEKTL